MAKGKALSATGQLKGGPGKAAPKRAPGKENAAPNLAPRSGKLSVEVKKARADVLQQLQGFLASASLQQLGPGLVQKVQQLEAAVIAPPASPPTARELLADEEDLREEAADLVLDAMSRVYGEAWAEDLMTGLMYKVLFSNARVIGAFDTAGALVGALAFYNTKPAARQKGGVEIAVVGSMPESRAGGVMVRTLKALVAADPDLHYVILDSMQVLPSGMTVPGKVMDREVSRQTYSFWRYMGWSPLTDKATRHAFVWELTRTSANGGVPRAVGEPWNTDAQLRKYLGLVHATSATSYLTPMAWIPA